MRSFLFLGAASAALFPACALAQTAAPATQSADTGRDIIVTASPIQHDRDDTPAISAKVDAEDILKSGGASIADGSYLLIPVRVMVDEEDLTAAQAIVGTA